MLARVQEFFDGLVLFSVFVSYYFPKQVLNSGIISERAQDVVDALAAHRIVVAEAIEDNGWCAMAMKKA